MDVTVYSKNGENLREITINDEVFKRQISEGSIWRAIHNEHANARQGTAKAKTRREVKGSTAKPWRQKGTGRARAGRKKSPLWRGGGVVFGPRPKDYSYVLPKKIKRLAMKSILSLKAQNFDHFRIIEDFAVKSGKTRDLTSILKNFPNKGRTVLILSEDDRMTKRAAGNVRDLSYLTFSRLKAHELLYGDNIIIQENAAIRLGEFYGEDK